MRERLLNLDITIGQIFSTGEMNSIDEFCNTLVASAPNLESLRIALADSIRHPIPFPRFSSAASLMNLKSLTMENFHVSIHHVSLVASVVNAVVFEVLVLKSCLHVYGERGLETGSQDGIFVVWA
ncbi:hypothetical protein HDU98_009758 [Podochytrium sp. JEL0797]|nr:hypothetical protein HDU98_009758 [Podochytrium sp. JEL0797]